MNMFSPKPAASLSSGLLARKGQAKPAMRRQGFTDLTPDALEDLGWNDMGDEAHGAAPKHFHPQEREELLRSPGERFDTSHTRQLLSDSTPPAVDSAQKSVTDQDILTEAETEVHSVPKPETRAVAMRDSITQVEVTTSPSEAISPEKRSVSVNTATRLKRETCGRKRKAAFTLRLDAERHLRLRLASAICNKSAQHLVTEALDNFLDTLPEVEDLMCQVAPGKGR